MKNGWTKVHGWLFYGDEGDFVENNGRRVEVANMCGGRYLLVDENGDVAGLTNSLRKAVEYLGV